MQFKILIASISLVFSTSVIADEPVQPTDKSTLYLSAGSVSFDSKVSAKNYIDDSATFLKFGWERHYDTWIFGGGISAYLYSDNASFSQDTTGGNKDSDASAINGYLEGGYKYSVNENVSFSILAGYEHVFSSEREISMCVDCYSEDIDISGGAYIQPRATYRWDNDWYVTASYNSYLSGDVDSAAYLTLGAFF